MSMSAKAIDKKNLFKRIIITLISVLIMGLSVSVLNIIDEGMDSFTYMNISISDRIGWSFGNWQMLLNILMFIPVLIWGRKQLGIGTVFNMVLVGYTSDFCAWIWQKISLEVLLEVLPLRIIVMLITVAVFVFAAAVYMSTELGTSPCDALPMMAAEKLPKVQFKVIRFLWDLLLVIIGFILSGKVGIVTILMVLFLGQTVAFVRSKMGRR